MLGEETRSQVVGGDDTECEDDVDQGKWQSYEPCIFRYARVEDHFQQMVTNLNSKQNRENSQRSTLENILLLLLQSFQKSIAGRMLGVLILIPRWQLCAVLEDSAATGRYWQRTRYYAFCEKSALQA